MDYQKLYEKAMSIQNEAAGGIYKDTREYAFVFVYPPPQALKKMDQSGLPAGSERDISKPVNLYLHIPYCTGKCKYCYFCSYQLLNPPISKSEYTTLLCREIKLINKTYGRLQVRSVHFGGGTPTTLSEKEFNAIFKALHDNLSIPDEIEITCESSPETLTPEKIRFLLGLGVNRLNIGIQTLDDAILKYINRRHNGRQALEAIAAANNGGFTNINVDLIYGLPGQTVALWEDNLRTITALGLQSISTYRLRVHPFGELAGEKNFHQENQLIRMYVGLLQIMDEAGYIQSSSHKFALERDFVQKQIISKRGIKDNELVAVGVSAYGYLGNTLYWNCRDIVNYCRALLNHELPVGLGYELDKREQMSKVCVLGVHNLDGIDLVTFVLHFGVALEEIFGDKLNYMLEEELIEIAGDRLKLSKLGMIFADEIATQFYSDEIKGCLKGKNLRYGIFFDEIVKNVQTAAAELI